LGAGRAVVGPARPPAARARRADHDRHADGRDADRAGRGLVDPHRGAAAPWVEPAPRVGDAARCRSRPARGRPIRPRSPWRLHGRAFREGRPGPARRGSDRVLPGPGPHPVPRPGRALRMAAPRLRGSFLCAFALALACSGDGTTPGDRVRAVLAELEEGARNRDAAALKEHVSEGYRDPRGHDKRAVAGLVTFQFLRNRSVHRVGRVRSGELAAPGEARAQAVVALAGTPIAGPEALPGLRA